MSIKIVALLATVGMFGAALLQPAEALRPVHTGECVNNCASRHGSARQACGWMFGARGLSESTAERRCRQNALNEFMRCLSACDAAAAASRN
jgi:hypothetical protein